MQEALGYDSFGNKPELLAEIDRARIDAGDIHRAGHLTPCDKCGCAYHMHPHVQGALWLHRICDGSLVKL